MGRPLKIGIYSPFFGSTLGGGEKYLGVTAEAVREAFPEHQIEMVTAVPVDRGLYERTLNLDLSGIRFVATNRRVTWFHRMLNGMPTLRLYRDLFIGSQAVAYTRAYDLFIAMVSAGDSRSPLASRVLGAAFGPASLASPRADPAS